MGTYIFKRGDITLRINAKSYEEAQRMAEIRFNLIESAPDLLRLLREVQNRYRSLMGTRLISSIDQVIKDATE